MKSRIILIANPTARRVSEGDVQKAVSLLRSAGCDVSLHFTKEKGEAEELARRASQENPDIVIAAGGDGTFNEVANGLAFTQTAMAILALGTTNVLAKELGIPEDVEGAMRSALSGSVHTVSLGNITTVDRPASHSRLFCLMAGIGFDGAAVYSAKQSLKKYSGKGAYIASGLKALVSYSPEPLTLSVDGETFIAYSAIIGNASKYGGNFKVTPDVSLFDRHLGVCIMQGSGRLRIPAYVVQIMRGRHLAMRDVQYRKASRIEIRGTAHVQIDGDYFDTTPAVITVVPDALKLIF